MRVDQRAVNLGQTIKLLSARAFKRIKLVVLFIVFMTAPSLSFGAEVEWNTFLGGFQGNGASVKEAEVDDQGFIYVIGEAPATWGSPIRNFSGFFDTFVAKYNPDGELVWNTFLGGSQGDQGNAIALDAQGNIYITGSSFGSSSWGAPLRPIKSSDAWVAKLNNNGVLIWNTFVGSTGGDDQGLGITVDGDGSPIVTGRADRAFGNTFSPTLPNINLLTPYHGGVDAFVLKLDSSGAIQFLTFVGAGTNQTPFAVDLDSNDNIYISGESTGSFGAPVRAYTSGVDIFVAQLNSAGAQQWNTFLGGTGTEFQGRVAVDASDNVYVTAGGRITWGTPLNEPSGFNDIILVRLNTAGALQWNTFAGDNGNENGDGIAIDNTGNIHVSGTSSSFTFGPINSPPTTPKVGSFDAYAAEFNSAGALLAVNFVGSASADDGFGIAVEANGDIVSVGRSRNWGTPNVPIRTSSDGFIAKICADCVTVTASVDAFGSVARPLVAAQPGGTASIEVTPLNGYITDTTVGGTCAAGSFDGNVYTTGTIVAGCTVSFTHSNYIVRSGIESDGSVTPASVITSSGNAISFTVTPDPGFFVTDTTVFGNCPSGTWLENVYTTGVTTEPCIAFFEPRLIQLTVDASVDENGSILVFIDEGETERAQMTSRSVEPGDSTTFIIEANSGFFTDSVVGGTCPLGGFESDAIKKSALETLSTPFTKDGDGDGDDEEQVQRRYTTGTITEDCTVSFTHTAQQSYSIAATDAVKSEGSFDDSDFTFTVSRTTSISATSSVEFAVDLDSSIADLADFGDRLPSGVIEFAEGELSQIVSIVVAGDTLIEADEMFTVSLFDPVNGNISSGSATGTILNDDFDGDGDGVADSVDNCPTDANPDQVDNDRDDEGDLCDVDDDNDTVNDDVDNCQFIDNLNQDNNDGDLLGDVCDDDDDNDTVLDQDDNCQFAANLNQLDTDQDLFGDACDTDDDDDGVLDDDDNCPLVENTDQLDSDQDGVGDVCPRDDSLCIPVAASNGKVVLICL